MSSKLPNVDPRKKRIVLVVSGAQASSDAELNQDKLIKKLIVSRLAGIPLNFNTHLYKYENINDKAQRRLRQVLGMLIKNLIAKKAVDLTADIVMDVLINLRNGKTAKIIRNGLKEQILYYFDMGNPLYIVAHSLGSIYSFDVINELMRDKRYFDPNNRRTWPIQGLATIGSPIGLRMFKRRRVHSFGPGRKKFRWINYWDRMDPVVSGSFYGKPRSGYHVAEGFAKEKDSGWAIRDRVLDTGKAWLNAHTQYWTHPSFGDDLVHLVTH